MAVTCSRCGMVRTPEEMVWKPVEVGKWSLRSKCCDAMVQRSDGKVFEDVTSSAYRPPRKVKRKS